MVNRLVAVDDADYRLPEPVRDGIARDATNNETELGATLASTYTDQARMGIVLPTEMTFEGIQAACDSAEPLYSDGSVWRDAAGVLR